MNIDLKFGEDKENEIISKLKESGWEVKRGNKTAILDFYIRKQPEDKRKKEEVYYIELKTRRSAIIDYGDTMIGANKLAESWQRFYKEGVETIFLFSFTDGNYYYNPISEYKTDYRPGRWDRGGIDKSKGWIYINNNKLKKWIKKK